MSYISYLFPGAETKPESVEGSLRRPWPYSVSLLAMTPRLNVQFRQLIESLSSMFFERYTEWMGATTPPVWRWMRAVKKIGVPWKFRRPPGTESNPQPLELRTRSSASSYIWNPACSSWRTLEPRVRL